MKKVGRKGIAMRGLFGLDVLIILLFAIFLISCTAGVDQHLVREQSANTNTWDYTRIKNLSDEALLSELETIHQNMSFYGSNNLLFMSQADNYVYGIGGGYLFVFEAGMRDWERALRENSFPHMQDAHTLVSQSIAMYNNFMGSTARGGKKEMDSSGRITARSFTYPQLFQMKGEQLNQIREYHKKNVDLLCKQQAVMAYKVALEERKRATIKFVETVLAAKSAWSTTRDLAEFFGHTVRGDKEALIKEVADIYKQHLIDEAFRVALINYISERAEPRPGEKIILKESEECTELRAQI